LGVEAAGAHLGEIEVHGLGLGGVEVEIGDLLGRVGVGVDDEGVEVDGVGWLVGVGQLYGYDYDQEDE
jgi:hypothetical protein